MLERITQRLMEATLAGGIIAGSFIPSQFLTPQNHRLADNIPVAINRYLINDSIEMEVLEFPRGQIHIVVREDAGEDEKCSLYIVDGRKSVLDAYASLYVKRGRPLSTHDFDVQDIRTLPTETAEEVQSDYFSYFSILNLIERAGLNK